MKKVHKPWDIELDPYTITRVRVMKSKLLSKNDYDQFEKKSVESIIKSLQEREEYVDDIGDVIKEGITLKSIEKCLIKNLANSFEKLKKISSVANRYLISLYLKRFDVYNVKTLLRTKTEESFTEKDFEDLLLPYGSLNKSTLREMYKKSEEEILNEFVDTTKYNTEIRKFLNTKKMTEIENY